MFYAAIKPNLTDISPLQNTKKGGKNKGFLRRKFSIVLYVILNVQSNLIGIDILKQKNT
tara:strand:+ start:122 stop:298 length:177 start_codon:yes stop_codon:yes gene_type:complete